MNQKKKYSIQPGPLLTLDNVACSYGDHRVFTELSFKIGHGDLCCLLGPSGGGKTSILRVIAGFEPIEHGQINYRGKIIESDTKHTPPEKRKIGMVFQEYALFPHLNVKENIGFGLKKRDKKEYIEKINEVLDLVQLKAKHATSYPHELSGGQQQRVALARALVTRPPLLLLDEPFSNLDAQLKRTLNLQLRHLLKELGIAALLVTHDQEEAFAFGDHIGVMQGGQLQQWDSAYNLYHKPHNRFVASFIGQGCFVTGQIKASGKIKTELGEFTHHKQTDQSKADQVDLLVRPDDIQYAKDSHLRCHIHDRVFAGDRILYSLALPSGAVIQSLMSSHLDFSIGQQVGIKTDLEHLIMFPKI